MYHCVNAVLHIHSLDPVADPEFIMGVPPPQKKNEFLPETGVFWCILGLLFTFMQKLFRSMGAPPSP